MKSKIYRKELAREKIIAGVNILADAVGSTLGARGRNVGIAKTTPKGDVYDRTILHDGISVAKAIELSDEAMQFGVAVARESAQKSVEESGDGTTATIILARALIVEAEKQVAAGISPMQIRGEIEQDITAAVDKIKDMAIPVTTREQMVDVATISAEEAELGTIIGETIHNLGDNGVVTVDKSKTGHTYVEHQEGMVWDRGMASPYFVTDANSLTAVIDNPAILVTDIDLNNFQALLPLLNDTISKTRFLVVIAPDFTGDVLPSFIQNKMEGKFLPLCVKPPSFGTLQTDFLQDIAILTGAKFITLTQGHSLEDVRFADLGQAERVSADMATTLINGGKGNEEAIKARIAEIEKLLEKQESQFEIEKLRERLAKLSSGVSVIKVGGATDIEIKERYERALDAALATRQAVKKGIVAGGEVVYLQLAAQAQSPIVKSALEAPFRRLVENAGFDSGQMIERLTREQAGMGIDIASGKMVNLVEKGIIDPAAVLISALTNASSVAIQLITTDSIIVPDYEHEQSLHRLQQ